DETCIGCSPGISHGPGKGPRCSIVNSRFDDTAAFGAICNHVQILANVGGANRYGPPASARHEVCSKAYWSVFVTEKKCLICSFWTMTKRYARCWPKSPANMVIRSHRPRP